MGTLTGWIYGVPPARSAVTPVPVLMDVAPGQLFPTWKGVGQRGMLVPSEP